MSKCEKLVDVGRRAFLQGGGIAAAGGLAVAIAPGNAQAARRALASTIRRRSWATSRN